MELFNYTSSLAQQIVEGKMDFVQLEQKIFKMVKAFGALLMEQVVEVADQRIFEQENRTGKSEGFRERGILTLFGEIRYRRRVYCHQQAWVYALDEKLGIEEKQTISPSILKAAAYMATQNSYRESANLLAQWDIHLSHQRIHQAVQTDGEAIEKRQMTTGQTEGQREAEVIVVESDGIHVALQGKDRQKAKSLEIKTGCMYEGWETVNPWKQQYRLKNPYVMAVAGSAKEYWEQVDRRLSIYDLDKAKLLLFGSDGAPWGSYGVELYPEAIHQIDAFHVQRWIKRVFGYTQQSIADTIQSLVESDDRQGFAAWMQSQEAKYPQKKKEIQKLRKTIEKHWESIKDYRTRAPYLPEIARGIGNIEHANDNLVADRMKKRGMAWSIQGAIRLVQVKAAVRNGEWDDVCRWVMEQAGNTKEAREEAAKTPRQRGRIQRGERRQQEVDAWCQAHMPGIHGRQAWLREFGKLLQRVQNPAL